MPGCCITACLLDGRISLAVLCRAVAVWMQLKEVWRLHAFCSTSCEVAALLNSIVICGGLRYEVMSWLLLTLLVSLPLLLLLLSEGGLLLPLLLGGRGGRA